MGKQKYVTEIKARIGAERTGDVIPDGTVNARPIVGREDIASHEIILYVLAGWIF
jgi:hypothetical protein